MKERIDDLNSQHILAIYERIRTYKKNPKLIISFLTHMPKSVLKLVHLNNLIYKANNKVNNSMWSIEFYDSIVAVKKRKIGRSFTLGRRV